MQRRLFNSLYRSFSSTSENVAAKTATRHKVIKTKDNRPIIQSRRLINAEHEKKAASMGLDFRIVSAR
jgi:hypothetical protein